MDFNSHMRNTSFLDKSATMRMLYFSENGFPIEEFVRLKLGPVIMKDEIEYCKEIQLMEELRVTLELAGLSQDRSSFLMHNEFWQNDGNLAARVTSAGGWLDLYARKLVAPPETLLTVLDSL